MVLVGNKSDVEEEGARIITTLKGQDVAARWGVPFLETSAKVRINVDEAFYTLVEQICSKKKPSPSIIKNWKKKFRAFILLFINKQKR